MSRFGVVKTKSEVELNQDRMPKAILDMVNGKSSKSNTEKRKDVLTKYLNQKEGTPINDNIAKGDDFYILFESLNEFDMDFKQKYKNRNWQFTYLAKLGALLLIEAEATENPDLKAKIKELKRMALRPQERSDFDFNLD